MSQLVVAIEEYRMEPSEGRRFALHHKVHCKPLGAAYMVTEKHEQMAAPAALSMGYVHSATVAGIGELHLPGYTAAPVASTQEDNLRVGME